MKRVVYLALSLLLFGGTSFFGYLTGDLGAGILIFFLMYIFYFVLEFVVSLAVHERIEGPFDKLTFMFGFITLGMTKVKYSDNDLELYTKLSNDGVIKVMEQGYFNMILLDTVNYDGDVRESLEIIKNKIDRISQNRIDKKLEKEAFKKSYKEWDGCVDLKTQRKDRLDKIL